MSNIEKFVDVRNSKGLKFDDIWRIYDNQFNVLRDFAITLGDKYDVETFTESTSREINLSHSYSSNQIFVYINEVIQWKDKDYSETTPTRITLLHDRSYTDTVRVVIIRSNVLKTDIEEHQDKVNALYETCSKQLKDLYQSLYTEYEEHIQGLYKDLEGIYSLIMNNSISHRVDNDGLVITINGELKDSSNSYNENNEELIMVIPDDPT